MAQLLVSKLSRLRSVRPNYEDYMSMHCHYRPYRPPMRSLSGRPPCSLYSSTGTLLQLGEAEYNIPEQGKAKSSDAVACVGSGG